MRQGFGTFVLVIAVLFMAVTTWSSASAPRRFAQSLGLAIADAGGTNEIRAQYAGFFFAVGVVCALALAGTVVSRQAAFVLLATVFGGLIAGRLASLAVDGSVAGYGPAIRALYVIDATVALSLAAMLLERTV